MTIEPNGQVAIPCDSDISHAEIEIAPRDFTNLSIADTMRQSNAPVDLKVVSWSPDPPGIRLEDLKSYTFEDTGGDDTYVYLIENGIEPQNPVSEEL